MVKVNKLKGAIVANGKTQDQIAAEINIDRSTFYRKMSKGGAFTIGEVSKMVESIPLTYEEAIDIFLDPKLHKCNLENQIAK